MKSKKNAGSKEERTVEEKQKPVKKNYNAKLKLDMSFKEALERTVNKK